MHHHQIVVGLLAYLCASCACTGGSSAAKSSAEQGSSQSLAGLAASGFDNLQPGPLPTGWRMEATNHTGPLATWRVQADALAPSKPNCLALTATNHKSQDAFNLCWSDAPLFSNGTLEVAVRADQGVVDQGGGLAWRVHDKDNYYIARFNPLESNYRVYYVKAGRRVQLASALAEQRAGEWHTMKIEHVGKRITCWLDGQLLLQVEDETLPAAGGVGFWTKADALSSFDSLNITHQTP